MSSQYTSSGYKTAATSSNRPVQLIQSPTQRVGYPCDDGRHLIKPSRCRQSPGRPPVLVSHGSDGTRKTGAPRNISIFKNMAVMRLQLFTVIPFDGLFALNYGSNIIDSYASLVVHCDTDTVRPRLPRKSQCRLVPGISAEPPPPRHRRHVRVTRTKKRPVVLKTHVPEKFRVELRAHSTATANGCIPPWNLYGRRLFPKIYSRARYTTASQPLHYRFKAAALPLRALPLHNCSTNVGTRQITAITTI
ncbi:hypothetical protein GGX14DRAFT_398996 [Mycena pura]|uniref:Uncharacterized protein n=1 Tax=Mycena pura TaxID=153505 RepID=A0AAD6V537_9AGAR|nr:hypothetical protein GGX14DRAFT_398996 [Mycena pura]